MFRLDLNLFSEGILTGILSRPDRSNLKNFLEVEWYVNRTLKISKILRIQMSESQIRLREMNLSLDLSSMFNSYASKLELFALRKM